MSCQNGSCGLNWMESLSPISTGQASATTKNPTLSRKLVGTAGVYVPVNSLAIGSNLWSNAPFFQASELRKHPHEAPLSSSKPWRTWSCIFGRRCVLRACCPQRLNAPACRRTGQTRSWRGRSRCCPRPQAPAEIRTPRTPVPLVVVVLADNGEVLVPCFRAGLKLDRTNKQTKIRAIEEENQLEANGTGEKGAARQFSRDEQKATRAELLCQSREKPVAVAAKDLPGRTGNKLTDDQKAQMAAVEREGGELRRASSNASDGRSHG